MPTIFKCPDCGKSFTSARSMKCHQGGAHRKGTVERDGKAHCKHCNCELIESGPNMNWPPWAVKQHNLICSACKARNLKKSNDRRRRRKVIVRKQAGTTVTKPFTPTNIY